LVIFKTDHYVDLQPNGQEFKNQNRSVCRVFKAESENIYNDCLHICKRQVIQFERS